jgi:hypothetical protein
MFRTLMLLAVAAASVVPAAIAVAQNPPPVVPVPPTGGAGGRAAGGRGAGGQGASVLLPQQGGRGALARQAPDPADSLYRVASTLYSRAEYRSAADRFNDVRSTFPTTRYFCDASYYEASSRYFLGLPADLRVGQRLLEAMLSRCGSNSRQDVPALALQINKALARTGDDAAAEAVRRAAQAGNICDPADRAVKIAALNALNQINDGSVDAAIEGILRQTDSCSAPLRMEALRLAARRSTPSTVSLLSQSIRNDPDRNNKLTAVRALGGMTIPEAVTAMEELVRSSSDEAIVSEAAAALARNPDPRAQAVVRGLIERTDMSERNRINLIRSLTSRSCGPTTPGTGGRGGMASGAVSPATAVATAMGVPAGAAMGARGGMASTAPTPPASVAPMSSISYNFGGAARAGGTNTVQCSSLSFDDWRSLYQKMNSDNLREAMLNAAPRDQSSELQNFLLNIARNPSESQTIRLAALSRVRGMAPIPELMKIYETADTRSLRLSIVNGLAQRVEPEATDRLVDIAKTSTDPQVRETAVSILGRADRRNDPRSKKALCEILGLPNC